MSSIVTVDAIRPTETTQSDALRNARARDIVWMKARKQFFVHVPCPACGSEGACQSFDKDGFTFSRCPSCKTLYMPDRPDASVLADFYADSALMKFFSEVIFPSSLNARVEHIYKPRLESLLDKCSNAGMLGGNYVEVGAGSGHFARLVQESKAFSQVLAVEPSAALAADCQACGLEVRQTAVERLEDGIQADVVASFEVLEHLSAPGEFIAHMHRILVPGGLCILTTPNSLGLDVLEFQGSSTTVGLTHLTLFNPDSITRLMRKNGFQVLEVSTPGKLDVGLLREGWDAGIPAASPFLSYLLREAPESVAVSFQKFLCDNLLSSHMWVVSQKKPRP